MARFGLLVASALAVALPAGVSASDVKFGKWMKDPDKDRYYCEYKYPAPPKRVEGKIVVEIKVQICIWYPNDAARKEYYYFANKDNKIWGRCVCPASPKYDPKPEKMQWSTMKDGKWDDLPEGDCPAPKDGDPKRAQINKIPDPPV